MRIDLSPLYRSAIGFDRLASFVEGADNQPKYPPYNVELIDENTYQILMAVAGFEPTEIDITSEQNVLTIAGKKEAAEEKTYLYQGIAFRNFERKFQLADHVKVRGAKLENGMLTIQLEREIPETMKPRKIAIDTGTPESESNKLEKETASANDDINRVA